MNPTKPSPSACARVFPPESQFHNPYTFKPFSANGPKLDVPNLLTDDEPETARFTGVLELSVKTLSPLLTMESKASDADDRASENKKANSEPKHAAALTIGKDVIVPATSIRGSLRSLLLLLTGGVLPVVDPSAYLCQGRDANLGPMGKNSPPRTPQNCFLARVIKPGSRDRDGLIELGDTELIKADDLHCQDGVLDKLRPTSAVPRERLFIDSPASPRQFGQHSSPQTPWEVKLSGRPVNPKGKREGAFNGNGRQLEIPARLWEQYTSRHRHGVRPELRPGDLIWLEPNPPDTTSIKSAQPIASLQWARWGRHGDALHNKIPSSLQSDYDQTGTVDEVSNLFGLVPQSRDATYAAFAGRIRPENLVFLDAADKLQIGVQLAPLAMPHPGSRAFYRNTPGPERLSAAQMLRGYKVYRTTLEQGKDAPWLYGNQPIFDDKGLPKTFESQKLVKKVDLLPRDCRGSLRIALRSLSSRELALILRACQLPWRLGGGKPFGLGHCEIEVLRLLDENGTPVDFKLKYPAALTDDLTPAANWWIASQKPVPTLRYPRAAARNANGVSRGGHVWFSQHATPRKGVPEKPGLEPLRLDGNNLPRQILPGQVLPPFNPQDPAADLLYGYDMEITEEKAGKGTDKKVTEIRPFDPTRNTGREASSGNTSQSRQTRLDERKGRTDPQPAPAGAPALKSPVSGRQVQFKLLDEKTKKGGWKAQCSEPGYEPVKGFIVNSAEMPADLQPGTEITLRIGAFQSLQKEYQLRYVKPDSSKK